MEDMKGHRSARDYSYQRADVWRSAHLLCSPTRHKVMPWVKWLRWSLQSLEWLIVQRPSGVEGTQQEVKQSELRTNPPSHRSPRCDPRS